MIGKPYRVIPRSNRHLFLSLLSLHFHLLPFSCCLILARSYRCSALACLFCRFSLRYNFSLLSSSGTMPPYFSFLPFHVKQRFFRVTVSFKFSAPLTPSVFLPPRKNALTPRFVRSPPLSCRSLFPPGLSFWIVSCETHFLSFCALVLGTACLLSFSPFSFVMSDGAGRSRDFSRLFEWSMAI